MSTGIRTLAAVTVASAGTKVALMASNPSPQSLYSNVRVEADKANTGTIFLGDLNVSSSRYTTKLTAGQSFVISGTCIDPARLFVDADTSGSKVQITLVK